MNNNSPSFGELNVKRVPQLRQICKENKIPNYYKKTKKQLIEYILEFYNQQCSNSVRMDSQTNICDTNGDKSNVISSTDNAIIDDSKCDAISSTDNNEHKCKTVLNNGKSRKKSRNTKYKR